MSLTDPVAVTISGSTSSLPRTSVGDNKAEYMSGDGNLKLSASHTYGKRTRRMLRIDTQKIAPDPFRPEENDEVSMSLYMVFDMPTVGFTAAEAKALYDGFTAMVQANSEQVLVKLLGGES